MRYVCPCCGTQYVQGRINGQIVLAPAVCDWCPDIKLVPLVTPLKGGKITPTGEGDAQTVA